MTEEYGHISDAFDNLPEEELLMTEEQQELYDVVSDWWDDVFVGQGGFKGRDACLIDLVNAIIEWKDQDEYVEDPWNLQPRQPMQPVKKPQQHPVEGFE